MIKHEISIKHILFVLLTAIILFFISVQTLSAKSKLALQKHLLLEKTLELPSKAVETKVIKVHFPPAYKTPWHEHNGPGPRYIIAGQLRVTEGGNTKTYSAGDVFWESGLKMQVENVGEGEAELIIFEMVPVR